MVAKLYSINLVDKTKLSLLSSHLRVRACGDLTDRFDWQASFLYFSLIFFIRTSTKANFYLAPPSLPGVPKLCRPYRTVTVEQIFLLKHPTWDENANERQTLCSQSAGAQFSSECLRLFEVSLVLLFGFSRWFTVFQGFKDITEFYLPFCLAIT